jgi:hypothetical protein
MRELPTTEVRVLHRPTTILAQERDALGNLLCIYRRYGAYHVGMVLSRGRCVPLLRSLYVTYAGVYERLQRELSQRQQAAEVRTSDGNDK